MKYSNTATLALISAASVLGATHIEVNGVDEDLHGVLTVAADSSANSNANIVVAPSGNGTNFDVVDASASASAQASANVQVNVNNYLVVALANANANAKVTIDQSLLEGHYFWSCDGKLAATDDLTPPSAGCQRVVLSEVSSLASALADASANVSGSGNAEANAEANASANANGSGAEAHADANAAANANGSGASANAHADAHASINGIPQWSNGTYTSAGASTAVTMTSDNHVQPTTVTITDSCNSNSVSPGSTSVTSQFPFVNGASAPVAGLAGLVGFVALML